MDMCCRYCLDKTSDELDDIIATAASSKTADKFSRMCLPMMTRGEIKPTNVAPVIAPAPSGRPAVIAMRWGYNIPGKANPILNARVETAKIRPTFKDDWAKHRCVVPASYYYEWEHLTDPAGRTKTGSKYLIQPKGASVTWLCGLYRIEDGLPYFVILTREPSDSVIHIHDRMPLMLPKDKIAQWTNPDGMPDWLISYALTEMVAEKV